MSGFIKAVGPALSFGAVLALLVLGFGHLLGPTVIPITDQWSDEQRDELCEVVSQGDFTGAVGALMALDRNIDQGTAGWIIASTCVPGEGN